MSVGRLTLPLALCLALLCLPAVIAVVSASTDPSWTALTSGVPVSVSLAANSSVYFTFSAPALPYTPTALLSIAALTGFPSMYVGMTASPLVSASHFAYSASWLTGGVVAVTAQAPWTLYVALLSSAYSASNLTLLAATYDPTVLQQSVIPLPDAQPVASAIAAGQYRYFLYTCTGNSSVTVANTETVGQTAIVVSAANAASLPTIASYAFSILNSALQLVVIPSPSTGDKYSIGVWANVSSVFTVIAAAAQDVLPMQLGVTYPGLVGKDQQMLFSLYVDPLLLPTALSLQFSLYSFTGDADLYCSNTTSSPDQQHYRWASQSSDAEDAVTLPGSQLYGGLYCCAVYGWAGSSSFSFTASFGSVTIISAGLPQEVESPGAGQQQLYSFMLSADSSASFVLVNVVCETGGAALYIAPYPATATVSAPWRNGRDQPVQSLQVPVTGANSVCGFNGGSIVPGSSPPLCQLSILVVTTRPTFYRISASAGQVVPLLPGQQQEGAVAATQSSSFSFSIPDNLSNITLLVFITNDATDVRLDVGVQRWPGGGPYSSRWTVQQQPGDDLLLFTLDWTDPLLPVPDQPRGSYVAVVSSQQNATFSILYTVMNASGNAGSITRLIDGMPQPGQLQVGQYRFFFFSPPQFGWPYTVTITVVWLSGAGWMRVAQGDGTQPAPLPGDSVISSQYAAQFSDGSYGACAANETWPSGLPCGYSISLQADADTGPVRYSITATSSGWVRRFYANSVDYTNNPLPALASDLWMLSVSTFSDSGDNLLIAVTAQAGSLLVFISNSTVAPNASTAQWVMQVTALELQLIPLRSGLHAAPFFFTILCINSSDCVYTLVAKQVVQGSPVLQRLYNASPQQGLLIAGDIAFYLIGLSLNSVAAYVLVSVVPQLGSASLFVSCVATVRAAYANETNHQWTAAGSGPLSVEISNVASANCSYVAIGVRAANGSNAAFEVMAATAGKVQSLAGTDVGYVTPQYNSSYYRYLMPDTDPTVVFSCSVYGSACLPQLQLLVSDSLSYPSPAAAGLSYNWSGSLITLSNGVQDLSVVLTNWSRPPGSLHAGLYYIAVHSSATTSCTYNLRCANSPQRMLQLGTVYELIGNTATGYFTYLAPADVGVSFGLSFTAGLGTLLLYLGVNSSPNPRDATTYSLLLSFNSSLTSSCPPIYVPASLCSASAAAALGGCALVFLAVTDADVWRQQLGVTTATSAASVWLSPQQLHTMNNSNASSSYAFTLPAQPVIVTVMVSATPTSAPLNLACSASYVSPSAAFYDWSSNVTVSSFALANQSVALSFVWSSPLVNLKTALQAVTQTCYCSVLPWPGAEAFNISFSYALLPEPPVDNGSSGLRGGALYAAALVPVVVTVLLVAMLLVWLYVRRGGDCGDYHCCVQGKQRAFARQREGGSQHADAAAEAGAFDAHGAVTMTAMRLNQQWSGDGQLMRGQQWYSDQ